nr:MAG TPA: hypothetical protein [Caudoviricetes sp.]
MTICKNRLKIKNEKLSINVKKQELKCSCFFIRRAL